MDDQSLRLFEGPAEYHAPGPFIFTKAIYTPQISPHYLYTLRPRTLTPNQRQTNAKPTPNQRQTNKDSGRRFNEFASANKSFSYYISAAAGMLC
jgi:hypothetical protein